MTVPRVENPDRIWTDRKSTCRYCVPMPLVGALHQELKVSQQQLFLLMVFDLLQDTFDPQQTMPSANSNQNCDFTFAYLNPRSNRKTQTLERSINYFVHSRFFKLRFNYSAPGKFLLT